MSKRPLRRRRAIGLGLVALDAILTPGDPGCTTLAAGGTCGNVMAILAYFGWDSAPVSPLAADPAGAEVRADLSRVGVDLSLAKARPQRPTPIVVERVRAGSNGTPHHSFSFRCPSCRAWLPGFRPVSPGAAQAFVETEPKADVVFVDRASRSSLLIVDKLRSNGARVVFEPSARLAPSVATELWRVADIVKFSAQFSDFADAVRPAGVVPGLEVETDGNRGIRYRGQLLGRNPARWRSQPGKKLAALRDPAGAGDWLTATLIDRLLLRGQPPLRMRRGGEVAKVLSFAQAVAARSTLYDGPRGAMHAMSAASMRAAATRIERAGGPARLPTQVAMGAPTSDTFEFCQDCRRG